MGVVGGIYFEGGAFLWEEELLPGACAPQTFTTLAEYRAISKDLENRGCVASN